jgi:hypothetical protein
MRQPHSARGVDEDAEAISMLMIWPLGPLVLSGSQTALEDDVYIGDDTAKEPMLAQQLVRVANTLAVMQEDVQQLFTIPQQRQHDFVKQCTFVATPTVE